MGVPAEFPASKLSALSVHKVAANVSALPRHLFALASSSSVNVVAVAPGLSSRTTSVLPSAERCADAVVLVT